MVNSRRCGKCGTVSAPAARFCTSCGAPLQVDSGRTAEREPATDTLQITSSSMDSPTLMKQSMTVLRNQKSLIGYPLAAMTLIGVLTAGWAGLTKLFDIVGTESSFTSFAGSVAMIYILSIADASLTYSVLQKVSGKQTAFLDGVRASVVLALPLLVVSTILSVPALLFSVYDLAAPAQDSPDQSYSVAAATMFAASLVAIPVLGFLMFLSIPILLSEGGSALRAIRRSCQLSVKHWQRIVVGVLLLAAYGFVVSSIAMIVGIGLVWFASSVLGFAGPNAIIISILPSIFRDPSAALGTGMDLPIRPLCGHCHLRATVATHTRR